MIQHAFDLTYDVILTSSYVIVSSYGANVASLLHFMALLMRELRRYATVETYPFHPLLV